MSAEHEAVDYTETVEMLRRENASLTNERKACEQLLAEAVRQGGAAIDELRGANAEIDYLRHLVDKADTVIEAVAAQWGDVAGLAHGMRAAAHVTEPATWEGLRGMFDEWREAMAGLAETRAKV